MFIHIALLFKDFNLRKDASNRINSVLRATINFLLKILLLYTKVDVNIIKILYASIDFQHSLDENSWKICRYIMKFSFEYENFFLLLKVIFFHVTL